MRMKNLFAILRRKVLVCCMVMLLASGAAFALEISDLHLPLTRDEADDTLSKEYISEVLNDGTLRRSWQLENRKVFIDFNVGTGNAILIAITYNKPVSKKVGLADANALAHGKFAKGSKWTLPKNDEARRMLLDEYGLENVVRRMMEDGSMIFCETDKDKKKILRVSAFVEKPKSNRWQLLTLKPKDSKTTALGGTVLGSNDVDAIYKDEERRRSIPLASSTSTSATGSSTPTAGSTESSPTRRRRGRRTVLGSTGHVDDDDVYKTSPGPSLDSLDSLDSNSTKEATKGGRSLSFHQPPPDWLKKVGIEDPQWWHYIVLGVGGLVLLLALLKSMMSASARSKQRKNYKKVVSQSSPMSGVKINRR